MSTSSGRVAQSTSPDLQWCAQVIADRTDMARFSSDVVHFCSLIDSGSRSSGIGLIGSNLNARLSKGAFLNLARRALLDNLPLIDDGDAIAQTLGLFDVMSGQQDCSLIVFQLQNQVVNFQPNLRDPGPWSVRREIEEWGRSAMRGRAQLAVSARRRAIRTVRHAFPRAASAAELVPIDMPCVEGIKQLKRFMDLHFVGQICGLKTNSDAGFHFFWLRGRIEAEHSHGSAAAIPQAFEYFNCGCLPCPVRTQ